MSNERLSFRLKTDTGLTDLAPVRRIDRDTAALVLFTIDPAGRAHTISCFGKEESVKDTLQPRTSLTICRAGGGGAKKL